MVIYDEYMILYQNYDKSKEILKYLPFMSGCFMFPGSQVARRVWRLHKFEYPFYSVLSLNWLMIILKKMDLGLEER